MTSQIQSQLLNQTPQRKVNENESYSLQKSHNRSIQQKIEEMSKSLSKVQISPLKSFEIIKHLQDNRLQHQKSIASTQQDMLSNLNLMQKSLLSFDRQRMMHQAGTKIQEEQITTHLDDYSYQLRKMSDDIHEKASEYRQQIASHKIEMIQLGHQTKQKSQKIKRHSAAKLISLENICMTNDTRVDSIRSEFKPRFKQLKCQVQNEGKEIVRQRKKNVQFMVNLEQTLMRDVKDEQKKQRDCFQQNYKALEEIFKLLSEGIDEKQ